MESRCAGNLKGERDHPSFSSTLLDAIYRSFDESCHDIRPSSRSRSGEVFFEEMVLKKQIGSRNGGMMKSSSVSLDRSRGGNSEERKSRIVDQWRQNTAMNDDDHVIRRRSLHPETTAEFAGLRSSVMSSGRRRSIGSFRARSSAPSSSDSGSGGRISSSSDADFFFSKKNKNALKPIRTSFSGHLPDEFSDRKNLNADPRPPKSDSGGKSAKSRALKLYGDLKRMKQPISPGGKLANFLNSLFSANGDSKKQRISSSPSSVQAAGDQIDTGNWNTSSSCSTASSYSRSCLSKRPSSSGRYDCGVKRSVRFCPVPVIVDENLETTRSAMAGSGVENKRVEAKARDLLKNYHQRSMEFKLAEKMEVSGNQNMAVDDNNDEDDDVESCCSSDLFELEIGVVRYCEELPVYETTRVDTNRAIATGRIA